MEMEVTALVGKAYYEITLDDIAEWWILGGVCGCCGHKGPLNRDWIERKAQNRLLRFASRYIHCKRCGNGHLNRFYIAGKLPR
ncbi:hypothetical protein IG197_27795 [Aminobacter sp. SR38]|jgi:hypothetical protein|uniref:hypothetical protein n=1 Tax=Aminobacter sp. SR38 TaxID=2774562 RepID=UPI00177D51E9|nr:hypothetical protein [Aminobacter sp. SR38]QOF71497.1 hypothetical protein IG197_27795 [Aminobacter sp. SR38]